MAGKVDMQLLGLLSEEEIKIIINSIDLDLMMHPFKKNSKTYMRYMPRLGSLNKKSALVKKNLPGIVYELYEKNDLNILIMVSINATRLKELFIMVLEENDMTPEEFQSKNAGEIVDFLAEYDEGKGNNVDIDLFFIQLKMNFITVAPEKAELIRKLWSEYEGKADAEAKKKEEIEQAVKEKEDSFKQQLKNQKKEFDLKLTRSENERKFIEDESRKKDKIIAELEGSINQLRAQEAAWQNDIDVKEQELEDKNKKLDELSHELNEAQKKRLGTEEKTGEEFTMEEINISDNIIIDAVDETIERLRQFSGIQTVEMNDIADFIKTEENTHFYLDDKMNIKNENDKGIRYLWLDTGLEGTNGKPIFLSLLYLDGYYVGHYAGDWRFLSSNISSHFQSNTRIIKENAERFKLKYEKRIEKRNRKHLTEQFKDEYVMQSDEPQTEIAKQISDKKIIFQNTNTEQSEEHAEKNSEKNEHIPAVPKEITNSVIELLLINNWKTTNGLDRYLKVIGCRLQQLVDQKKSSYYILNNIKSAVVNTGLLNKFGADIYIMYRYHVTGNVYVAYKIIESKTDYLENGFTKEQISQNVLPINFFDEGEEMFVATLEDFDVNHRSLMHIIEDRRDRFPENVRNLSANTIATKINNALDLGLRMQKRDRNYAKPSYSSKNKTISWMLPLRINRELTEEPELVLVIRKSKEFFEIKTIIPYDDDMKDKITALSLYNGLW